MYKKFFFIFFASLLLTTIGIYQSFSYQYVILFIFILCAIVIRPYNAVIIPISSELVNFLPILMLVLWVYGIFNGVIQQNSTVSILRNFAGMSFYIVFYILLVARPTVKEISNFLVLLSSFYIVLSLYSIVYALRNPDTHTFDDVGIKVVALYYSIGISIVFIPLSLNFFYYIARFKEIEKFRLGFFGSSHTSNILTILICFLFVLVSGSKGFYLAFLWLFSITLFIAALKMFKTFKTNKIFITILLIIPLIVVSFASLIIFIIGTVLVLELASDSPRVVQSSELIADFTLFGRGLGGVLPSGYTRDPMGYGFELTYHNVIHKFGIFSVPIFFSLFFPIFIALRNLLHGKIITESVLIIGLMCYLFPAYGNPLLFAPLNVIFHVLALYIISKSNYQKKLQANNAVNIN